MQEKRTPVVLIRLLLLIALLAAVGPASCLKDKSQLILRGRVTAVKDGDTIVILQNRSQYKIRLSSIDSPEKGQAYGTKARQFTSALAYGKQVRADVKTTDQYSRYVAEVFLPDGRSLSREIVRNGYAWHYPRYSYDPKLTALEKEARNLKRGLWADPHPIPPWQFRRH